MAINLKSSPKILGEMSDPDHLCISFKLETDPEKLTMKMNHALEKYKIDFVIGNFLGNKLWAIVKFNKEVFGEV